MEIKKDSAEDINQDTEVVDENLVQEEDKETTETVEKAKENKHQLALEKIEKSKEMSRDAKSIMDECMANLEKDIATLDEVKLEFQEKRLKPSEILLQKQELEENILEDLPDTIVQIDESKMEPKEIKNISKGVFKASFLALLSAIVVVLAWCISAVSSLGLKLIPEKILDLERINKVLEWISLQFVQNANANIGIAVVIASAVLVMIIVYMTTMSLRAKHNLALANKTEEEISLYCTEKEECRKNMKLIRDHIKDTIETINGYGFVIDEQIAKINRALYFEDSEDYNRLQQITKDDFAKTRDLNEHIKSLLAMPIAELGVLTKESIDKLEDTKKYLQTYVDSLYIIKSNNI